MILLFISVFCLFVLKQIKTSIQKGCIKLIKSDSIKDF